MAKVFSEVIFILKIYISTALSLTPVTAVWLRETSGTEDNAYEGVHIAWCTTTILGSSESTEKTSPADCIEF